MKILYIGEYRNATLRGECSIDYMRSLLSVGAEIVARPFIVNDNIIEPPQDILKLENNKCTNIDYIIQDVDEDNYDVNEDYKNFRLASIPLPYNLNTVYDYNAKLNLPIQVQGDYLFYWMGSLERKDNLVTVLRAFHHRFPTDAKAQLVINIAKQGEPQQIINETVNFCNSVKHGLGLYNRIEDYKTEIIIPGFLSPEQRSALHNTCNCFVDIKLWGDEYDREWLQALHKNRQVIRVDGTLEYTVEPVFNGEGYKGFSKNYDFDCIMGCMTNCYKVGYNQSNKLSQHSYETVGNKILGLLK